MNEHVKAFVDTEHARRQRETQAGIDFAYGLRCFLDYARENPDAIVYSGTESGSTTFAEFMGFVVEDDGIKFLNDFRIASKGTLHLKADKHVRVDSGGDKVPDRKYLHSVFLNTKFKDGEPEFPKHVPYAMRQTTARAAQKMGRKKLKGGCGCGGRCGGH